MKYEVKAGREVVVVVVVTNENKNRLSRCTGIVALLGLFAFGAIGEVTGDYHVFDTLGKTATEVIKAVYGKGDGRKN
jgi:hypothetical protein